LIIKHIESTGQAAWNGKSQLLEGPSGVIALHTHRCKLVRQTASVCETIAYQHKDLHTGQDQSYIRFPVVWKWNWSLRHDQEVVVLRSSAPIEMG
jgi:hypothetical protein